MFLTAGVLIISMSTQGFGAFKEKGSSPIIIGKEFGLLIIFVLLGMSFLIVINDFISLYLAIEFQSFGLYILSSYYKKSEAATSAGLKYFLLGAISSSFILLGAAIIYTWTGLTNLDGIMALLTMVSYENNLEVGVAFGLFMLIVGLLFKVAAAPFHQ